MRKPKKSKMPKRKWSSGRGALIIIASFFAMSALVRLGAGTGQAIAKEVAAFQPAYEESTEPQSCKNPDEIELILGELAKRDAFLKAREQELGELEQSLTVAKEQIQQNLSALVAAEKELSATIVQTDSAAENDLARLTSVYENMKPKQAAILFEEMAPEFAAGFVGRMRADVAAQIMAGLSPKTAYTISVILAGRNALAPTE